MALYMTYTCAKSHFFKYYLSLYTLSAFLSPITQLPRSLFVFLAFGFFFSGFPLWFFISGFFISFLPSPSPGDYFFRYVDSVHLIYDFFVPPHKYENFFCFSYQSFVLFMFLMIFFFFGFPARFFSGFSCGSFLFLRVIISSFWVFLIKVSFF